MLWKRPRAPARFFAPADRLDPELEYLSRLRLEIILRVPNPGPGAHDLHIARFGTALVAEAVLVGNCALPHISDDFHIGMRVRRKPRAGSDLVVIPNPQGSPSHALRVEVIGKREMMLGVEPVVMGPTQFLKGSALDHVTISDSASLHVLLEIEQEVGLEIELFETHRF